MELVKRGREEKRRNRREGGREGGNRRKVSITLKL
jgi:hypothetical protein